MIKIKNSVRERLIEHAKKYSPVEACGYLAGKDGIITKHYELSNADNSNEHYSFVPEEQFNTVREARKESLDLIAVYHSHPASPARMSDEDIRLAHDPEKIYVIISLYNSIELKAFRIYDKKAVEEKMEVIE